MVTEVGNEGRADSPQRHVFLQQRASCTQLPSLSTVAFWKAHCDCAATNDSHAGTLRQEAHGCKHNTPVPSN